MFGKLFDFNNDGELNLFERTAEFTFLDELMQEEETEEKLSELESSGLDRDELENMDEEERKEALEDAGFDPDEYDF